MRLKNDSFKLFLLLSLVLGTAGFSLRLPPTFVTPSTPAESARAQGLVSYSKLPLHFELNQGQTDAQVKFMARGRGYNLFLTPTEAVLVLQKSAASPNGEKVRLPPGDTTIENRQANERAVLRMKLVGANSPRRVMGLEKVPGKVNYFIGNDPVKWRTNLPTYRKVQYESVYPGVDLVYYGNQRQLEYDFVVAPSADPASIALDFAGADRLELNTEGDLILHIANEQARMHKPVIYQEAAGVRQEIVGSFVLSGKNRVAFQIGEYDASRPLIIDPVLTYAGYLGGAGQDFGNGITIDNNGHVYVVGYTDSNQVSFPVVAGPDLTYNGNQDVFVTKLTADGTQVAYSGYIGGSGQEFGMNIAVDGAGNAYIIGYTNSNETTFPVIVGPDLSYNGGQDTFVAKLSTDGSQLLYAGYIGGSGNDFGNGIAVDGGGNSYIVGTTTSTEATFPVTVGPDLTFSDPGEGYVAKINADGASLIYAGYIGGSGDEAINAVALDPDCTAACQAYIAGSSASDQTTFPIIGGPDLSYNGGTDAFVAKVKGDGTGLVYAGYIGGSGADYLYSIAVDSGGNAYVYGNTDSTEATFPVIVGPGLTYQGGRYDAFIAKLNATGTALIYVGYIGGAGDEFGRGIAVDDAGNAYVAGWTSSTEATFPVSGGPDLTYNGGISDVFVAKVNAVGTTLDYAGYIGGNSEEMTGHANPIAVDRAGNTSYVIGSTSSSEATFPVTIGPDLIFNGAYDGFVAKVVIPSPVAWNATQDSFLRSGNDNTNEGANLNLIIRSDGNNRALVTFALGGLSGPVSQANLRLYIVHNADNWGNEGRTIDAHRVTQAWMEGNGANLQPGNLTNAQFHAYENRGAGPGVTWRCAVDAEIHNQSTDCSPQWNGGAYLTAPTASVRIFKDFAGNSSLPPTTKTMGWITFDVTMDVNTCLISSQTACSWLIKKTQEGQPGRVEFASKEGAVALYNGLVGEPVAPQLAINHAVSSATTTAQAQLITVFFPLVKR